MPATRSRTAGWRRCLQQICARRGSIELALECNGDSSDLLLRARVIDVQPDVLLIEAPVALGNTVAYAQGTKLVGVMAVGQNRWMFHTTCTGHRSGPNGTTTLVLSSPAQVQRCQRRIDYRIETARIDLPEVSLWPLLDPSTAVPIERLTAAAFLRELDGRTPDDFEQNPPLPAVGPCCTARLLNLGGGGVGLGVPDDQAGFIGRHTMWWVRFQLPPALKTPVVSAARLAHSHIKSDRTLYLGMSFDFSANALHRRTVSQQLLRAVHGLRHEGEQRRSA
ncbi:MAG: hypothetical protein MK074_00950 [Phycisphaerales bacterium]|nr:hypothetical protein [Phycisphaerales bacterium]